MIPMARNSTTLSVSPDIEMTGYDSNRLLMYHVKSPIDSSQDEARSILAKIEELPRVVAVLADIQLKGRGTQVCVSNCFRDRLACS